MLGVSFQSSTVLERCVWRNGDLCAGMIQRYKRLALLNNNKVSIEHILGSALFPVERGHKGLHDGLL